jgi:25S rRNA (cytosine2870-C5)-methyltransferase
MKNSGILWANDSNKDRAKAIIGNLHRMGIKNTIVSNYDGRDFPKVAAGFDRVLVDAPCAGLGVISRDPAIKMQKVLVLLLNEVTLRARAATLTPLRV